MFLDEDQIEATCEADEANQAGCFDGHLTWFQHPSTIQRIMLFNVSISYNFIYIYKNRYRYRRCASLCVCVLHQLKTTIVAIIILNIPSTSNVKKQKLLTLTQKCLPSSRCTAAAFSRPLPAAGASNHDDDCPIGTMENVPHLTDTENYTKDKISQNHKAFI